MDKRDEIAFSPRVGHRREQSFGYAILHLWNFIGFCDQARDGFSRRESLAGSADHRSKTFARGAHLSCACDDFFKLPLQLQFPGIVERNVRHVPPRVGLNVRETLSQLGQLSAVYLENRTIRIEISQPRIAVSIEKILSTRPGSNASC